MDQKNNGKMLAIVLAVIAGFLLGWILHSSSFMKVSDQDAATLKAPVAERSLDATGNTETANKQFPPGTPVSQVGSFSKITSGAWSLPVCATATLTCPAINSVLWIDMVGGGGSGNAGANPSTSGGGGGGAGDGGAYMNVRYTVPAGTTSLGGIIGTGGLAYNSNCAIPCAWFDAMGQATSLRQYVSGSPDTLLAIAGGGYQGSSATNTPGGLGGYNYALFLGNTNYTDLALSASLSNQNGSFWAGNGAIRLSYGGRVPAPDGGAGLTCSGGGGGVGVGTFVDGIGTFGKGGNGGHGGYHNDFPGCTEHGNGYGRTNGTNGGNGAIKMRWIIPASHI